MKIVKGILLTIAALIALVLIAGLFVKNEYEVHREITIDKPKHEVFAYVRNLKNQDYYSKWVMTDPEMKKEFRGTDGTVGFVYAWDGNDDAGAGEQEITAITEGEQIDIEIRFKRPFEAIGRTPLKTQAVTENQTKVTWSMFGNSHYPLNVMNFWLDDMLGPDMDQSLNTLKNILEKQPETAQR